MSVRTIVYQQLQSVAQQQGKTIPPLTDDLRLLESGFDSLCTAILIANLDDQLNASPFDSDETDIPVTVGDLIMIYEKAAHAA